MAEHAIALIWFAVALLIIAGGLVWQGYNHDNPSRKSRIDQDIFMLAVFGFCWPAFVLAAFVAGPPVGVGWLLYKLGRALRSSA